MDSSGRNRIPAAGLPGHPFVPFRRIGLPSAFVDRVGGQEFLRREYRLTPEAVAETVMSLLENGVRE